MIIIITIMSIMKHNNYYYYSSRLMLHVPNMRTWCIIIIANVTMCIIIYLTIIYYKFTALGIVISVTY